MSSDPASLLQKQVKIHSVSAKPELNDKIGVAQSYLPDRNRYLVSLPPHVSASPIALKADNLTIPTMVEKAKGKVDDLWGMLLTVYNDDNVRSIVTNAVLKVESLLPPNVKIQHAFGGVLFMLLAVIYFIGFAKLFMLFSLLAMVGVVALPDIMAKKDPKTIAKNFPARWKEAITQNTGYRPSQKMATGILIGLLLFSGKVLLTPTARKPAKKVHDTNTFTASRADAGTSFTLEEIYKMGFEDASNEKIYGESLPEGHSSMSFKSASYQSFAYDDYEPLIPQPPPKKSKFGFGTIMSVVAIGRMIMELGFVGGRFEPNLFIANVKNLPPMRLAFMGFMLYRVISAFT